MSTALEKLAAFGGKVSFGMDIGGTLAKVVYFAPDQPLEVNATDALKVHEFITSSKEYGLTGKRDDNFSYHAPALGGTLHFIQFQTCRMGSFLKIVQEQGLTTCMKSLACTGGGAHKFEEEFKNIGVELMKIDEMDCLVQGVYFLTETCQTQMCYTMEKPNFSDEMKHVPWDNAVNGKPFLLVNIGSGISILRVDGPSSYSRVGGSSLGGATFLALSQLLTGVQSFEEVLRLAEEGDSTRVDMLVRDIYGGGYETLGLSPTVVAASFGNMINKGKEEVEPGDMVKAALIMITNNIGSLAHLHSKIEGVDTVVFAGNFLMENEVAKRTLAFAMNFWSQNQTKAVFFENVGYSGAVGALTADVVDTLQEFIIVTAPFSMACLQ